MSRGVLKSNQTIRFYVGPIRHSGVESPREHETINDRKPFDENQRAFLLAWTDTFHQSVPKPVQGFQEFARC